jgi:hypothetical protein
LRQDFLGDNVVCFGTCFCDRISILNYGKVCKGWYLVDVRVIVL